MKPRLIVIGNGMAGARVLEEVVKHDAGAYELSVFGDEPHANYDRIQLSPVLAGEKTIADIMLNDDDWYKRHHIALHKGRRVIAVDRSQRHLRTDDGRIYPYDKLVIATGSRPFILPIPGVDLPGVMCFRNIADIDQMLNASRLHRHAVVIGGGLLGLEAANGLLKRGMNVSVVHILDTLLDRQLDQPASALLRANLMARGIKFYMSKETAALEGDERVTRLRFKDGETIAADLVVMAVGIRPDIDLAQAAGLSCGRGVIVGSSLQTSDSAIYAVGECTQFEQQCYGLVAPLYEQARIAARHLCGIDNEKFASVTTATRLKVSGVELFSVGDHIGVEGTEKLLFQDAARGVYKKLVLRDNRIEGAVLYGDTEDGAWYYDLIRQQQDISKQRAQLLFGPLAAGGNDDPVAKVNALPDSAEICGCNGVCKGTIVNAIKTQSLNTLDDVRAHTKASASCGSCTPKVEALLLAHGGVVSAQKAPTMCACTSASDDDVRAAIGREKLMTAAAIRAHFKWQTPDGCAKCRPALNYYLLCAWPGIYRDDNASRFINERVHANIQKDGTYSVVPRIWGGVTTPSELRAIADIAERFDVPTVKITGGQRIDLLGIKKEQLPAMWGELNAAGFVSGHAYGKSLRTVKTCVGSQWCRFGTQDSTALGIALERATWGAWTPHKVKLAVSGCPRNCAEATIKDVGVVCVDSGYELHVAGNGGIKVRVTDFLVKVDSEDEVFEYTFAFMQMYREQARYLERTAQWIERVGFESVRAELVDNESARKAYALRFEQSQKTAQIDPWQERANGVDKHEYRALMPRAKAIPVTMVG